jgi:trans-aconitate methyltransferase
MSLSQLEQLLDAAKDQAFRARATSEYRRIKSWVQEKIDIDKARVLDFGCGQGIAACSFALRHPNSTVVGTDIEPVDEQHLARLVRTQIRLEVPKNLRFFSAPPDDQKFDLVYAWSVFQHIREEAITATFASLKNLLAEGGVIFVQASPLYFSPQGSLLNKYFKSPWHHLILSLDQLRDGVLSSEFRPTQSREWKQFMELNRTTTQDVIGRASAAGLKRLREQIFQTDLIPPPRLTRLYCKDALLTTEFMALFE